MTNEEAKHIVDIAFGVAKAVRRVGEERTYHEDEIREAKNMAMEALEQESIIDEIMAEINTPNRGSCDYYIVDRIEDIINKYRAESE